MTSSIGNESAPIQLAQCRFPGLAISNAKILIYFSNKIHRKQFFQTALGNCYGLKLPKCWLQFNKIIECVICYKFRQSFVPCWADRVFVSRQPSVVGVSWHACVSAPVTTRHCACRTPSRDAAMRSSPHQLLMMVAAWMPGAAGGSVSYSRCSHRPECR